MCDYLCVPLSAFTQLCAAVEITSEKIFEAAKTCLRERDYIVSYSTVPSHLIDINIAVGNIRELLRILLEELVQPKGVVDGGR